MKTSPTARLEADLATLFNVLWYQDFPVEKGGLVGRSDWTIHIGICVRRCADLLGWRALFEQGGRTDAVLKDGSGRVRVNAEWEWIQPHREAVNEIDKLRESTGPELSLLVSYSRLDHHDRNLERIERLWTIERPLLVFLVTFENAKNRHFRQLMTYRVASGKAKLLRAQPALPWEVPESRWAST